MRSEAFTAGAQSAMTKTAVAADVGEIVYDAISGQLEPGLEASADDELDELMPNPGQLEKLLLFIEDRFDFRFGDREMARLFAVGTVDDLVKSVTNAVTAKTAAYSHRSYMMHRERHKARSRAYRMTHAVQLRKRAKAYRRKVERGMIRPRKRIGSAAGGYQFVMR
jgi:hypothetical protein